MMRIVAAVALAIALAAASVGAGFSRPDQQQPRTTFRSGRDLVSVDVVVRDREGNIVRGLTAADFEVREDGRPQEILGLSFEEIVDKAAAPLTTAELRAGVEQRRTAPSSAATPKPRAAADVAGHR